MEPAVNPYHPASRPLLLKRRQLVEGSWEEVCRDLSSDSELSPGRAGNSPKAGRHFKLLQLSSASTVVSNSSAAVASKLFPNVMDSFLFSPSLLKKQLLWEIIHILYNSAVESGFSGFCFNELLCVDRSECSQICVTITTVSYGTFWSLQKVHLPIFELGHFSFIIEL